MVLPKNKFAKYWSMRFYLGVPLCVGDGPKASQNYPLRLGPGSFGSKLMDLDGLKVSNFQLKI